jgi:hypothetical protein
LPRLLFTLTAVIGFAVTGIFFLSFAGDFLYHWGCYVLQAKLSDKLFQILYEGFL